MRDSDFRLGSAVLLLCASFVAHAGEPVVVPVGSDGVQRIQMVGGGYFFGPEHIVVRAHAPVEILVRREAGIVPHTFVLNIPDEGVDIDQDLSTEVKTVRFTIHKPGQYAFYCRNRFLFFESHRAKGMQGVIEVVEK
jgi:plastocyanin domain-containing protein